jgi:hypothetical protein
MIIIEDVWKHIKSYMFHNIKIHGKHLKNDPYIIKFNNIMKNIPKPIVPFNGPRIIFSSYKRNMRYVKFLYHINYFYTRSVPNNSWKKLAIVEYQLLGENYDENCLTYDSKIREEYFNQYK